MPTKEEIREYFAKFGRKGGKASARKLAKMSPEERSAMKRRAAEARWGKKKSNE